MSTEQACRGAFIDRTVSLADVIKFKVELHKIAKEDENDLKMFTHYLDHAVRLKAHWRHNAIKQCLSLLDKMVLRTAFDQQTQK